jgi:metal-responsive CopG/Arc/MetJ family transcriptional regulator
MKVDDILNKIPPKGNTPGSLNKKYGIFGLTLGEELKTRLDKYCEKHNIAKSQLIKALLIRYLDQEEVK